MLKHRPAIFLQLSLITLITIICTIQAEAAENKDPSFQSFTISLERMYLDGETSVEVREESFHSLADLSEYYQEWLVIDRENNRIVLKKQINDISPLMKATGYFGINKEGILTVFEGKPGEEAKVIQSFFQLDVGKLESKRHTELEKGIRVESRKQYLRVIETFKAYGTPASRK
ncbi:BofC C-terminal domain-containing protein [Bacillus sp. FJAT-42376]|uniref:BofC C-terminal domain-containing protein n=1 Tax=Bacillus sp. FJAT-42376 TaxID=2014076 RepID=UPI001F156143|nr:BofC C-terminal domain-containing protein [Bacillus sp. FJAT-42376]